MMEGGSDFIDVSRCGNYICMKNEEEVSNLPIS